MQEIVTSLRLYFVSVLICCIAYPALLLGFAALAAPAKSEGSLIRDAAGKVVGSQLIAQKFTLPKYFWPRPSACDYKADAASGSNLSPTNPDLTKHAEVIIASLEPRDGKKVPPDLLSASGSGLDPHITLAAARLQAPRVAAARDLALADVEALIEQNTDAPTMALLGGERVVNVLRLNLALDALKK